MLHRQNPGAGFVRRARRWLEMPVTQIEFPILSTFLCAVESMAGATFPDFRKEAATPPSSSSDDDSNSKPLPKGVVLGPDGKPYVLHISIQLPSPRIPNKNTILDAEHAPPPPHGKP